MRGLGDLHDVVDTRGEVALRPEDLDAGVEELAHRALPARSKLTPPSRSPASGRRFLGFGRRLGHEATLPALPRASGRFPPWLHDRFPRRGPPSCPPRT